MGFLLSKHNATGGATLTIDGGDPVGQWLIARVRCFNDATSTPSIVEAGWTAIAGSLKQQTGTGGNHVCTQAFYRAFTTGTWTPQASGSGTFPLLDIEIWDGLHASNPISDVEVAGASNGGGAAVATLSDVDQPAGSFTTSAACDWAETSRTIGSSGWAGGDATLGRSVYRRTNAAEVLNDTWAWTTGGADTIVCDAIVLAPAGSSLALVSSSPADNATGVAVDENIVLTYSAPISDSGSGSYYLRKSSDNSLIQQFSSGQFSIAGSSVTLNPTAELLLSTGYYVEADANVVKRTSDNDPSPAISGATALNFTTAAAVEFIESGTIAYSGTNPAPAYPTAGGAYTNRDVVVLFVGQKPSTANGGTVTTPGGFTLLEELTGAGGYGATLAADTGNTNLRAYVRECDGTESGAVTVTTGTNNVAWAVIVRLRKAGSSWTVSFGSTDGSDTTAGNVSITGAANPGITIGDLLLWAMCIPTDVTTPSQFSAHAMTATGATIGTATEIAEADSTTNNDIGGYLAWALCTAGTASAVPTFTATAGGTTTNVRGPGVIVRVRAAASGGSLSLAGPSRTRRAAGVALAPSGSAPRSLAAPSRRNRGAVGASLTAQPVTLNLGRPARSMRAAGLSVAPSGASPVSLARPARTRRSAGLVVSPAGAAPLALAAPARRQRAVGVSLSSPSGAISLGRPARLSRAVGLSVTPSGAAPRPLEAPARTRRSAGVTNAPSGSAPVALAAPARRTRGAVGVSAAASGSSISLARPARSMRAAGLTVAASGSVGRALAAPARSIRRAGVAIASEAGTISLGRPARSRRAVGLAVAASGAAQLTIARPARQVRRVGLEVVPGSSSIALGRPARSRRLVGVALSSTGGAISLARPSRVHRAAGVQLLGSGTVALNLGIPSRRVRAAGLVITFEVPSISTAPGRYARAPLRVTTVLAPVRGTIARAPVRERKV